MKIKIRKASIKDAIFFYELRNEKSARNNFFNKKNIKYNDHLKWYKKKIKKKNAIFLVALINNSEKIGTVRYETEKYLLTYLLMFQKNLEILVMDQKL